MDVYQNCPVYQNDRYRLRLVNADDAQGLLKVYSDPEARPLFNSDNCSGGFSFGTLEQLIGHDGTGFGGYFVRGRNA